MKKLVFSAIVLTLFMTSSMARYGLTTESMTPDALQFFVKTAKIADLVDSANYALQNLMTPQQRQEFMKDITEFKQKTGIDPLNTASLKKAGVDVAKPMAMAFLLEGQGEDEQILIFLPVLDEKKFPLTFSDILKKTSDSPAGGSYPVMTEYSGNTLYQLRSDFFATSMKGYFVFAPRGELIQKAIDTSKGKTRNLASNSDYNTYLRSGKAGFEVNFFATKDFIGAMMKKGLPAKRLPISGQENANALYADYRMVNNDQPSLSTAMKYLSMGLGLNRQGARINISAEVDPSADEEVNRLLRFFKTGTVQRGLYLKDLTGYIFFSFDFSVIEDYCKGGKPECNSWVQAKQQIEMATQINLASDFFPHFSGAVNVFLGTPKNFGENKFAMFIPMNSENGSRQIWQKVGAALQKKYKDSKRFGSAAVGGNKAWWFIDDKNQKNYLFYDKRGLYAGNDMALLQRSVTAPELSAVQSGGAGLFSRMTSDLFFMTYVSRNSFLGALLSMQAQRQAQLKGAAQKLGDVYVTAGKKGNLLSADIELEFQN